MVLDSPPLPTPIIGIFENRLPSPFLKGGGGGGGGPPM